MPSNVFWTTATTAFSSPTDWASNGRAANSRTAKRIRLFSLFSGGSGARLDFDPVERGDRHAVHVDRPTQVRSGCPAGRADIPDHVALLHRRAFGHGELRHVQVDRFETL